MKTPLIIVLTAGMALALQVALQGGEPIFIPVKIDGPVHEPANHAYWYGPFSECCSVADFDGDSKADLLTGQPMHRLPPEENNPAWERWQTLPLPEPAPIPRRIHGEGPAPAKKLEQAAKPAAPASAKGGGDGWITLFDGSNLDAWTMGPDESWVVEDGAIALKREFDGKEHNADYLWTRQPYGDSVLELEFKVPERGNSGVFLRTSDPKDPVFTGIEVQVSDSFGRNQPNRGGTLGAIYDCKAPAKNAAKPPGEWQRMRVTCDGPKITVEVNGEVVNEMDLDRWTEPHENPDGSKNKFGTALKDFAREGYIGLQDHGRPVWYRNIRVKPLN